MICVMMDNRGISKIDNHIHFNHKQTERGKPMAREILFDLGKMITDRLPYKFGLKRLTEDDPE